MHGVDEDGLTVLKGLLNELEKLIGDDIAVIEDGLWVGVWEVVSEVFHIPFIGHLVRTAVDDVGDLVRKYKF